MTIAIKLISKLLFYSAIFAVLPLYAHASYLPDYQGPTFDHIVENVQSLAAAYTAVPTDSVSASYTHVEPLAGRNTPSMQADITALAYLPQTLYETAQQLSDALAPVGESYARVLAWVGDIQAQSYRQTAAVVGAYDANFPGLSDAQMEVYKTVSDSLSNGLGQEAAVLQATGTRTFSLYMWWTGVVAQLFYNNGASHERVAYAGTTGEGGKVVAAYTVIMPLRQGP